MAKFQQPAKYAAKKLRKEKNYEEKKKTTIENDQRRITEFMNPEEELILNYESDSLDRSSTPIDEELSDEEESSSSKQGDESGSTPSPYYSPSPDRLLPDISVSDSDQIVRTLKIGNIF